MATLSKKISAYFFNWPVVSGYSLFILIFSLVYIEVPEELTFPFYDKALHGLNYLFLAFLSVNTLALKFKWQTIAVAFSYTFFLGLFIEVLQYFLPYRNFELTDILFNFLGSLFGSLFLINKSNHGG